jgi:glycosidase
MNDSNSLFHHYKQLIQIRQSKAALHKGAYAHVPNNNEKVFSFLRTYNNEQVLVAINLSAEEQELAFEQVFQKPVSLFGHGHFQHQTMRLNPYQVVAYVVK